MSQEALDNAGAAHAVTINPYLLPQDQQGWRGTALPGNRKRKWYTILENEFVLVTALIVLPGERTVRHSHETGELSITFKGDLQPLVTWHPPGVPHAGDAPHPPAASVSPADLLGDKLAASAGPDLAHVLQTVGDLQAQVQRLQQELATLKSPSPAPRLVVDVLFPPFKTTILDPAYPEGLTITGQWVD